MNSDKFMRCCIDWVSQFGRQAAMLWVGWFGFNGGSALAANGLASSAFAATHFAAAAGALGWMFGEWLKTGRPTVLGAISGAVAGLVIITPASGFTTPMWGLVMGLIGGVLCMFSSTTLKTRLGYDDSLDAFGVHGVGGTVGAILTGVFAVGAVNGKPGLIDGHGMQVVYQLAATLLTWGFAAVGSLALLKLAGALVGLRVTGEQENVGLDLSQHGEAGYNLEEASTAAVSSVGHGIPPAESSAEPRPADAPPNGRRHFSIKLDGAPVAELTEAWSNLCQPSLDGGPSQAFREVYPFVTTVSGAKFRFRGGEPAAMKESLVRLFEQELNGRRLTARMEAA